MLISVVWNINVSIPNIWWISSHIQSIYLSFHSFEENESISFVSSVILPGGIFSWKLPMINRTTMPELIHNIVSSYFEINVMDIHFKYFLAFIVKYRFIANISWMHSSLVLSSMSFLSVLRILLILFIFSTISSLVQIILIFLSLIFKPHWMLWHWCLGVILLHVLLLDWRHVILMVLVIIWRLVSLVLHSYLLMVHWWPVTSILSHFLLVLWLSISTILPLHRLSVMVIWMHIIHIPNLVVVVIRHLSLIWLMVILPIVGHFMLVRVMVVHLFLC